jgi:hypothetical protein
MTTQTDFRPMTGFLLVQSIFTFSDPKLLPPFLLGEYDAIIQAAFFFKEHNRAPENETERLQDEVTKMALENLKNYVRTKLQLSFNSLEESLSEPKILTERPKTIQELARDFKAQHAVSDLGTVSEISAKYNISKKKVRKLKQEGTLYDFIDNL